MGACCSQPQPVARNADGTPNPYMDEPKLFQINGRGKSAKETNAKIDKDLEEEGKTRRRDVKILLLGAGESGKSTVVKQMKIIHQDGYTREELMLARMTIFKNILESAQAVVLALRKFGLEPFDPENRDHAEAIISYRLESVTSTLLPSGGVSHLSSPLASYPASPRQNSSSSISSDLPPHTQAPARGYVGPANDPSTPYHYRRGETPEASTDEEDLDLPSTEPGSPGAAARRKQRQREIAQRGVRGMGYANGNGAGWGSYTIGNGGHDFQSGLTPELVLAVESLWNDQTVQEMVKDRQSDFYLMDSADYFFNNIRRIGDRNYVPNQADYLHCRVKTTGITETYFRSGQLSIHMFDVGGQRSERKKWIHCFEGVTSIIFCVALSEYDQTLLEEAGQNRLCESLVLFESVINSRWFIRTSVILFLNKIDLFRKKLATVPLERYFPEYAGGGKDINRAAKYILWRFTQLNRQRLAIYPHLTQATDTSNIRLVFAAVRETILQNALRDSGIL